jgi:hypothetical protein
MCASCKPQKNANRSGEPIRATTWGGKGDGKTDDSRALQYALDALPARGGKLILDKGIYLIGRGLKLTNKTHFVLEGNGATIISKAGLPKVAENALLTIINCENFEVKNMAFDGNRDRRPTVANQMPCHNLRILDVRHAEFVNIISDNAMQDGFTLQDGPYNQQRVHHVRFIDCIARNNFRQGLSVINGSDIHILGGEYSGSNGVGPETGIDIEANKFDPPNERVYIKGATFRDNRAFGVIFGGAKSGSKTMFLDSCFFYGNVAGAVFTALDETSITRCIVEGDSRTVPGGGMKKGPALIHAKFSPIYSLIIRDNILRNTSGDTWGVRLSGDVKYAEVVNNTFENMPSTALVIYAEKALVLGNTFKASGRRDIQVIRGSEHKIYSNTFTGKSRSLLYNESTAVQALGNTFNSQQSLPSKLLEQRKPLLTSLPQPRVMARSGSSSSQSGIVDGNYTMNREETLRVRATKQLTIDLPTSVSNNTILIYRDQGVAPITLRAGKHGFDSGEKSATIPGARKVTTCYFDGSFWRIY